MLLGCVCVLGAILGTLLGCVLGCVGLGLWSCLPLRLNDAARHFSSWICLTDRIVVDLALSMGGGADLVLLGGSRSAGVNCAASSRVLVRGVTHVELRACQSGHVMSSLREFWLWWGGRWGLGRFCVAALSRSAGTLCW